MRYGLIAAAAVIAAGLAGCGQQQNTERLEVHRSGCIETRCVAAYHSEQAPYWTEQQQRFCPSSALLEIWGTEPQGAYRGTWSRGQFSKSGLDTTALKALPAGFVNAPLAELVYYSFIAGAGFELAGISDGGTASIEGQRYAALTIKGGSGRSVTVYKNAVTGRMELVRISNGKELDWLARSSNLRYNERFQRTLPRKIDVFDIQRGIASKALMVQFDYIDVQ